MATRRKQVEEREQKDVWEGKGGEGRGGVEGGGERKATRRVPTETLGGYEIGDGGP